MTAHAPTIALIVAAGESRRMGEGLPKPYRLLNGQPVLRHVAETFINHPLVDDVLVVIHPDHEAYYNDAVGDLPLLPHTFGGATRQESAHKGVEAIFSHRPNAANILIHDAARAFVDNATITRVVEALHTHPAACPVVPVTDTIKHSENGLLTHTPERARLFAAQTPQGFHATLIRDLHKNATGNSATDDAALAEQAGLPVCAVEGDTRNIKLTYAQDMERFMPAHSLPRIAVGQGYDVHELIPADGSKPLIIGGITIAHTHVLKGHSDADVALHALVDAVLGALGEGDIGQHFPPSDPQWKGADSARFVAHVVERMHQRNAVLHHADITLICEAPKIGPHKEAMRHHIAQLLGVPSCQVNVKATTTEGLGFEGRREGIACTAAVTLALPWENEA